MRQLGLKGLQSCCTKIPTEICRPLGAKLSKLEFMLAGHNKVINGYFSPIRIIDLLKISPGKI